jgi:hypothetical protein
VLKGRRLPNSRTILLGGIPLTPPPCFVVRCSLTPKVEDLQASSDCCCCFLALAGFLRRSPPRAQPLPPSQIGSPSAKRPALEKLMEIMLCR